VNDTPFDAIVIGTGFGGAVAACRLAQAGKRICVLERGRRYPLADFPRPAKRPDNLPHIARWAWAIDHGLWDVYLGPVKLGRLFEETLRIEDHLGRLKRINV